jgi:CO/xanthine dehydrogenase FAD-binding subunit
MRSYVPDFDLITPETLKDALDVLGKGEGWRPIAGGTDLMVLFNAGRLPFARLVNIRSLEVLHRIDVKPDALSIGAAVSYTQIRNHPVLQQEFPMLCQAASWTGGMANQNRGTLGGNIANASPAADSAPVLLAYDATLQLASKRRQRQVPYASFHTGYKTCDLTAEELIVAIELPRSAAKTTHYARKVGPRQAQAISKVSLAATAQFAGGVIHRPRLAFGSIAPTPLRCTKTEAVLAGRAFSAGLIAEAQATLRAEIAPIDDIRSTAAYRQQVSLNLLASFLRTLA